MTSSPGQPDDTSGGASSDAPPVSQAVAIVAGHADFAAGVVSAVAQITGRGALLMPLTNRGLGAVEIERMLRDAAAAAPVRVIFTDLPAGSCTIAARRLLRDRPDLRLVTGANLPAVLDFVLGADCAVPEAGDAAAESARRLTHAVERGRGALMEFGAPAAPAAPASPSGTGAEVGGAH